MDLAYYNGQFLSPAEVRIPLSDRAYFFGDAVYEAAIAKRDRIYLWDKHMERLLSSLSMIRLSPPMPTAEITDIAKEILLRSGENMAFLYLQLSRCGGEGRRHAFSDGDKASLLILALPFKPAPVSRVSLISKPDVRHGLCNIKTTCLLPAALASGEAVRRGADEAVFIRDGIVTECARSNIFIRHDNSLITHPESNFILSGITRKRIIELAPSLGFSVLEEPFTYSDMLSASEVFITSSSHFSERVTKIDETPLSSDGICASDMFKSAMFSEFIL